MVVNGGIQKTNDVLIENSCIKKIQCSITGVSDAKNIDVEGTVKTESIIAAVGDITSYTDTPNT